MITTEFLPNGYIIHNQNQISIEINYEIKLLTSKNTIDFMSNTVKSVIDFTTGQFLYIIDLEEYDGLNQLIDQLPNPEIINPYWDFETQEFYDLL